MKENYLDLMESNELSFEKVTMEVPTIEAIEIVCQNTPDFTHGTKLTIH